MLKLIVLLVFTSTISLSLADIITEVESSETETQSFEQSSEESSSSSSSYSQSQTEECGPPVTSPPKCTKPNEVREICPAPCPARTCGIDDNLRDCAPSPRPGDPKCPPPACKCKPQFFRDDKGNCVPWKKCPKCKGPNEVYDPCFPSCPGDRCDLDPRLVRCREPPSLGDKDCVVGCRCIDGYARNKDGVCIPREKCPQNLVCGSNEVYDPCPDCSLQTCETMNATYHCPLIPADKTGPNCNPSCRCKKGYFRNKIGECISASDCQKCTKPHEYYSCGGACDNVCDTIREQNQTSCPIINVKCNEMCYCEADYARDYKNDCIPIKDCPICPANEKYDPCPETVCTPQTCDEAGFPRNCTLREDGAKCPGKPGCICRDGYLRNKKGKCVPSVECPSCGGDKNATYGCGVNCNRHCSNLNQTEQQGCILICYPNSCDCRTDKDGNDYYYDDNTKQCVLPKDCTPSCKANEVYSDCINGGCSPRNCSQLGNPVPCPKIRPEDCIKGCVCAEGYLRAKNGTCIPVKQCPTCGNDPHAESGCGVFCDRCSGPYPCPRICKVNGCQCKKGYIYDPNTNKCVLPKQCTPTCKVNEVYSDCVNGGCSPRNCSQLGNPVPCPKLRPEDCIKGCVCADGYLRAKNGTCIPVKQCPTCGNDPNAESGCGVFCDRCSGPYPCPKICKVNGCQCKKGYIYDENTNKCVLPKQCTPTCGTNEYFDPCPDCSLQTCETINATYSCPAIPADKTGPNCKPSCRCKKGYYRNKIGQCISESDCQRCTKPHEYYSCGGACDNVCNTIKEQNQTNCPIVNVKCNEMCYCEKDYARDYKNDCIPIKDCPTKCKGPNEVYDPCFPSCPGQRCDLDLTLVRCRQPPSLGDPDCVVGCRCIDGYARNNDGVCIPREKCPPKVVCGSNEVYDPCPDCSLQTCETMNATYHCPLIPADKTGPNCKPSCRCKKGYFRNKIGACISASDCQKCTKPHEYYSCGGACDNVCDTIKEQNQTNCPIINIKCNEMCYCEADYARDYKNDCIQIKDCPICPANEKYDPCPETVCTPQTCDEAGFPRNCTLREDGAKCPGKPGCICRDGYLRNKKGKCVPSVECPSCGGDKNATYGCGVNCNRHCSNLNQTEQQSCILICYPNSCDCRTDKDGNDYYYDDNTKQCVLPKDCTPSCKANEVYSDCINGGCSPRNCSQLGNPVPCPKIRPEDCIKGCVCAEGYLRAKNGTCIPVKQCPTCGNDPNAESGCGVFCDRCSGPYPCPKICKVNGCQCKKGYIYDENTNKCVLPKQCTPTCGTNEYFDPCPDCSLQTCETINATYSCPAIPADKTGPNCKPSCRCKKGYYRNKIGQCISESDCQRCTKPHEYYSCGGACDNVCDTIKEQNQTNCPIVNVKCNEMCYCEKDYARDYKNDCIPIKDCPICPTNEKYDPCPATVCGPRTCDEAGFPRNCTLREDGAKCPGKPGCICRNGYLRNNKGICIPSNQCPSCGGDNNATLGCGVNCNRHCRNLNQAEPELCVLICKSDSCDCRTDKNGNKYYYDDNTKKCVLPKDCTPQCTKNEVFSECVNGGCDKQKCTDINKPVVCLHPKECKSGCKCAPGFLRAKNGTCVPSEKCDPPPNCKANEEFSKCGRDGCLDYYCSDLDLPPLCRDTFQCIPQCECKEGYLRASFDNNTCVPVDQCKRKCKDNEQHSDCPLATCQPQTCKQAGFPIPCPSLPPDGRCPGGPGCICKPDYLRNDKGICVPKTECPSCGGDKNAVPGCGNHCGKSCATYKKPVPCPLFCNLNGCDCRGKYVYDDNLNKCVLPANCTPTCKTNEEFTNCLEAVCRIQDCSQKGTSIACIAIAHEICTPGCICKEKTLRAKNGTCVPEDQCDQTCPDGEILTNCPPIKCDAEYCPKSRDDPQTCPIPKKCGPARCVCGFNRHRDRKTGKCIATADCPPFPCDGPYENYNSCPPVCPGETCIDYLNNSTCPKFKIGYVVPCKPACRCNKGYYRDSKGICVRAKKCKDSACEVNEEFSTCANGLCRVQDCADKGKCIPCPVIKDGSCTKGCVCKKNFLRLENGTCIPEDECDEYECW